MNEPTSAEYTAAVAAFHDVEKDLEVDWVAHNPIQGEATAKVFGYRIAKAVLNASQDATDNAEPAEVESALERLAQAVLDGRVRIKVEHTRQNSCGDVFVTGRETHTLEVRET